MAYHQTYPVNAYPTALDYSNALQTPYQCLQDETLRRGQPICNALGLPRVVSGNFATVIQIRCPQQDYAVRCFTHPLRDRAQRYQHISDYLNTVRIPSLVPFEFLAEGIKVNGQWYPLLKMRWVAGDTLEHFIATHLHDAGQLLDLANRWAQLIAELESVQIAHSDLQHGNIIISDDHFYLIDYDNLYVPALIGQTSDELGHPNYQHPARTINDFNEYGDRFAAWVIYLSLVALALNPNLWYLVGAGDDFILLQQKDFLYPERSLLLALLTTHEDERIKLSAKIVEKALYCHPAEIPSVALLTQVPLQNLSRWKTHCQKVFADYLAVPIDTDTQPPSSQTHWVEWLHWFQESAQAGHAEAQYTLGWFYVQGQGVEQDFTQAIYWFQQAAQQGDAKAQYHLGQLYADTQNKLKAAYWNTQAARQGHLSARQDQMRLFVKAAEQGSAQLQYTLALIYASKKNQPDCLKRTLGWLQRAAQNGHVKAQYQLARMHDLGDDIPKQPYCALKWYKRAAKRGHLPSIKHFLTRWFSLLIQKYL
ncbi:MAG: hypothetical protein BWK79_18480 [Beggiatoa sp. IS2]|nr:MAG: hypothetical protein BWK79_18480 [Beggiatoa sp. IS2]